MCADYSPSIVNESDIRNITTPPLDYNDVSTAEILLKIEMVETYVKRVFFEGGSPPTDARPAVIMLVISNILSRADLAKKYGSLSAERLGDYSYEIAESVRGAETSTSPLAVIKGWHKMAIEMLDVLSAGNRYQIRKANE